eukprot:Gregarina_sp_Poly_1__1918@NODE_14_length_23033_cov_86_212880_g12_i0_p13_GENE_NODE_14_length_23033_cov_86_212880_g12_i0NODE_14_length_23033_cov_86_212880_g12_i0_p13_ORF_typecomplete_len114_score1_56_NODE_14_length_23033_cov_86_212880_g12_i01667517016
MGWARRRCPERSFTVSGRDDNHLRRITPAQWPCPRSPKVCSACGSPLKPTSGLTKLSLALSYLSFFCLVVNPVCWCITIFFVLMVFFAGSGFQLDLWTDVKNCNHLKSWYKLA